MGLFTAAVFKGRKKITYKTLTLTVDFLRTTESQMIASSSGISGIEKGKGLQHVISRPFVKMRMGQTSKSTWGY